MMALHRFTRTLLFEGGRIMIHPLTSHPNSGTHNPAYRHEYKAVINAGDDVQLCQRLSAILRHDPNAGPEGDYLIRSLYFDNNDDKALREKLDGLPHREKFRLRTYGENSPLIKLEKKEKHNLLTLKTTALLTIEETKQLLQSQTEWMSVSKNPLILEFYAKIRFQRLRPQAIVAFRREAFVYKPGNVRITLDRHIRSGLFSKDFLNSDLPTLAAAPQHLTILEVKYDAFLPDFIRDLVQLGTRRTTALSKYALCRQLG
jgi:hypothetical protein